MGGGDPSDISSVISFKNCREEKKGKTTTLPRVPAVAMACERGGIPAAELLLASFLGLRLRIFLTSKEKYPPSTEESPLELFINTQFDPVFRRLSTTLNIWGESCDFGMTAALSGMVCWCTRLGKVELRHHFYLFPQIE